MGTWEHIKLGSSTSIGGIRFFCCGRSLKIHIENEKGVVYVASFFFFLKGFVYLFGTFLVGEVKTTDFILFLNFLNRVTPKE
jgi:hypothetical protein